MDLRKMFGTIVREELVFAIVFSVSIILSLSTVAQGQTTTRYWSDNSGSFTTEAELLKIKSTAVILKKTNQVVIEVPFSRLSQSDLDFVKKEISRLNGSTSKPTQQIATKRSPASNISSRNNRDFVGETLPSKRNNEQLTNSAPPVAKAVPQQAPLRYAAKPEDFVSEPSAFAEPVLPDSIPAVIPSKDNITSPTSNMSRLKSTSKLQNQFSLGHPRPKKPPIILKSPTKVVKSDAEKTQKPLGKIDATFEKSRAKPTSYESPVSTNDLRFDKTNPNSSDNDLRSRPFVFEPDSDASGVESNAVEKANQFSGQNDHPFFPPESENIPNISTNNELGESNEFSAGTIVAINQPPSKNAQKNPDSKSEIRKIPATKTSNLAFNFDKKSEEVENVFRRPLKFAPRAGSTETTVRPVVEISKKSLTELPPLFRRLAEQITSTNDQTQIRAVVSELQSGWPSQRYPAIVSIVQQCVAAEDASTRILAIETLALKDSEKSLEYIVSGVDDSSFNVREATHKIIEGLSEPQLIPLLVERFDSDQRQRVASTLSKLGPGVEPHVLPFASHKSVDMQLTACNLLGSVGTKKSIKTLQTIVANSKQTRVRLQAANAIDRINSRSTTDVGLNFGP